MDKATPAPIMTTDTDKASDKLVEMLRASGAETCNSAGTLFMVSLKDAVAFRDRIIASLCGDVEPVAWSVTCDGEHVNNVHTSEIEANRAKRNLDRDFPDHSREVVPLAPASTVAALKAERDAALARVAELEKDAARLEFVCNSPNRMVERESGLWRVYEDVAPTDHPTAVWQGMTPRWHVTPREAIDAAITAALTKGQP